MILQALSEYYERKAADPDSALAPPGFETKAIPFLIIINDEGQFVALEDTRTGEGRKLVAQSFLVPSGVKKTSGVAANLLWDTAEYVLGVDTRGKPDRVAEQHRAFVTRLAEIADADVAAQAVLKFLGGEPLRHLSTQPLWNDIRETNPLMTFRLQGHSELVCQRTSVVQALAADEDEDADVVCLITGERGPIERLHPAIKGVRDAQTSGANIVSFNLDAFCSYGKSQGNNAPVGKKAAFAYTTALNHLLRKGSPQRFQIGDATAVAWAARPSTLETALPLLFSDAKKDDPDAHTVAVRSLFASIRNGAYNRDDGDTPFHVLGLAPNNARIAVRFWHTGTVAEFSERIAQYFQDLDIVGREKYGYPSLFRLLLATAAQHKADNINPLLSGTVVRAVLEGLPLPEAVLQAAIRRQKIPPKTPRSGAEELENRLQAYERTALIKACLNRTIRRQKNNLKELTVALDTTNHDPGYRLGRLFAVLERLQEDANRSLNATIRDRYYSAASSAPVTVFSNLMRLSTHHLGKLSGGQRTFYEKLLGEVMEEVHGFPAHLPIEQQGLFAIGYYHQRQALFQKRNEVAESTPEPVTEGE